MADEQARKDHVAEAEVWLYHSQNGFISDEMKGVHAAMLAQTEATLALAEQQRIANLIAYEALRIERTNAGGNYYGPSVVWGNPATEHGSSPLYDDIATGLGVSRG